MSTHNLCFEHKYEQYQSFLSEKLQFLEVKFSIYLNTCVFVMLYHICKTEIFCQEGLSKHCRPRSNCSCR